MKTSKIDNEEIDVQFNRNITRHYKPLPEIFDISYKT